MTTSDTPRPLRRSSGQAWRRAFLRELAHSGSVASAAQHCGIDRSSAYQLRKRNAAFAASWDRALEAARQALNPRAGGDLPQPGATPMEAPACAGAQLVVRAPALRLADRPAAQDKLPEGQAGASGREHIARPREVPALADAALRVAGTRGCDKARPRLRPNETIRASKAGRVCIARVGPGRWSARSEAVFLAELTASANVKAAARAAGVSAQAAYNRRKLWPAFAEQWRVAVAEGFARIETLLVCAATTTLDPEPLPERAWEAPVMSMDQALGLYKFHANQRSGKPQRNGWRRQEPDIEEVRAEIMRKVAAIKRARQLAE